MNLTTSIFYKYYMTRHTTRVTCKMHSDGSITRQAHVQLDVVCCSCCLFLYFNPINAFSLCCPDLGAIQATTGNQAPR